MIQNGNLGKGVEIQSNALNTDDGWNVSRRPRTSEHNQPIYEIPKEKLGNPIKSDISTAPSTNPFTPALYEYCQPIRAGTSLDNSDNSTNKCENQINKFDKPKNERDSIPSVNLPDYAGLHRLDIPHPTNDPKPGYAKLEQTMQSYEQILTDNTKDSHVGRNPFIPNFPNDFSPEPPPRSS